jgi:putative FmdB family regulatory protein
MPIYEYRCRACRKRSTFLTLSVSAAYEPKCKHCGSLDMEKLVSRVAMLRSEESRMESLADPAGLSGLDEDDPASVSRWMKKMGREMGEDLGEDFEEEMDRAVEEAEGGGDDAGGESGGGSPDDL